MIRSLLHRHNNLHRIAIIENDKPVLYSSLIQKASAIQQKLGTNRSEPVALLLPNGSDYIAALCAVLLNGQTVFPINAALTAEEILPLLQKTSTRMIIASSTSSTCLKTLKKSTLPELRIIHADECDSDISGSLVKTEADPNRPMVLLCTSGSTGTVKIVQLSEHNVAASLLGFIDKHQQLGLPSSSRFIVAAPFSSAYGLMVVFLCLFYEFPIIVMTEYFTLQGFYKQVQEYQVTHYEGGPMITLLMEQTANRPIPFNISSLRMIGFGGNKAAKETLAVLRDAYGQITFSQGYGMTEASPLIAKNISPALEKTGSVGTAITGVDIAIDADGTPTKKPYAEGEVIVAGPNVMLGYYGNDEETACAVRNGYLHTGDIGYLDEEGFLYICGRKKNIIIVRGHNVYPEEIEACLLNSLLVKDCMVYGQTDAFGNEVICADVVPCETELDIKDIQAYFTTRLAPYKYPRQIRMVDSIKKAASGKTDRKHHS